MDHGSPSFQANLGSLAAPDPVHPEAGHSFPSFQATPCNLGLAAPDTMYPGLRQTTAFPSFQAIPGGLGAPDRAYPGADHSLPSGQAIPSNLRASDTIYPETGYGFPSFQAIWVLTIVANSTGHSLILLYFYGLRRLIVYSIGFGLQHFCLHSWIIEWLKTYWLYYLLINYIYACARNDLGISSLCSRKPCGDQCSTRIAYQDSQISDYFPAKKWQECSGITDFEYCCSGTASCSSRCQYGYGSSLFRERSWLCIRLHMSQKWWSCLMKASFAMSWGV